MKKVLIALVVVFILLAVGILIIGRTFYPDNVAKTSPDGGAKGLKSRVYRAEADQVVEAIKDIVPGLTTYGSQWKIVDEAGGSSAAYSISVEVPVIIFTDDLKVIVKSEKEVGVTVDVESQSRVGQSDFGENSRHVRKLLEALDEKLN